MYWHRPPPLLVSTPRRRRPTAAYEAEGTHSPVGAVPRRSSRAAGGNARRPGEIENVGRHPQRRKPPRLLRPRRHDDRRRRPVLIDLVEHTRDAGERGVDPVVVGPPVLLEGVHWRPALVEHGRVVPVQLLVPPRREAVDRVWPVRGIQRVEVGWPNVQSVESRARLNLSAHTFCAVGIHSASSVTPSCWATAWRRRSSAHSAGERHESALTTFNATWESVTMRSTSPDETAAAKERSE